MKHAYLILAHNHFDTLEKLLKLIDDERNDIFIHIDKKTRDFPKERLSNLINKSKLYWVSRVKTYWGDFSIVQSELNLIKKALESGKYSYLHLISGVDLPLKTQDEIHRFFDKNFGKEFIGFESKNYNEKNDQKLKYYYILQKYEKKAKIFAKLQILLIQLQQFLKIDRLKNEKIQFQKGCNWFSITSEFAQYIIEREAWISKIFRCTNCPDEFFVQTILKDSKFYQNVYEIEDEYISCMREIDWNKGAPYVWRKEDKETLRLSPKMFARKFDETIDEEIINIIYSYIIKEQEGKKDE